MKKGFLSVYWIKAQALHTSTIKGGNKDWVSIMIQWMVETSWEMCEERNKLIHGSCIQEACQKKAQHLQKEILLGLGEQGLITDLWRHQKDGFFAWKRQNG